LKKHDESITLRLTGSYLAVFLIIIVALSTAAYLLIAANYRDLLGPALGTLEGETGLRHALRTVLASIVAVDLGLVLFVGAASYALARAAVLPLLSARRREERFTADVAHELRTPLALLQASRKRLNRTMLTHAAKRLKSLRLELLRPENSSAIFSLWHVTEKRGCLCASR